MNQVCELIPTMDEVKTHIIATCLHSCNYEYFMQHLDWLNDDPQRPHDLVGDGNKYEWDVIKGLALINRNPKPNFGTYIFPAIELHRQQYHHQKWNNPDPNDETKPIASASEEDMLSGAVDAVCSLLENRGYQGGIHGYDAIIDVAKKNPPHKIPWLLKVIAEMRAIKQPNFGQTITLNGFMNIGIRKSIFDAIITRTHEVIETLNREQGFSLELQRR